MLIFILIPAKKQLEKAHASYEITKIPNHFSLSVLFLAF